MSPPHGYPAPRVGRSAQGPSRLKGRPPSPHVHGSWPWPPLKTRLASRVHQGNSLNSPFGSLRVPSSLPLSHLRLHCRDSALGFRGPASALGRWDHPKLPGHRGMGRESPGRRDGHSQHGRPGRIVILARHLAAVMETAAEASRAQGSHSKRGWSHFPISTATQGRGCRKWRRAQAHRRRT